MVIQPQKLKQCLTNGSNRIAGVKNLWKQTPELDKDGKDFENYLKEIEDDWVRLFGPIARFRRPR